MPPQNIAVRALTFGRRFMIDRIHRSAAAARCRALIGLAAVACAIASAGNALAAGPPEIRISATNPVPACVTPERLMAFVRSRNPALDPRYKSLAAYYKLHGEAWRVRWDYAFFQMAIETNFLTYRRPDGRMGDVDPKQNNFAGIGTTGGGVPGDSFPDVKTGVLAQIQHLVVYSGETIEAPVAPRTQLKQEHILLKSRELNRPVRFSDLARRWAADPKYGQSIEWAAESFRAEHCRGKTEPTAKEALPWASKTSAPLAREPARAPAAAPNATSSTREPDRAASPVRTIWTRDQRPSVPPKVAASVERPQPPQAAGNKPAATPAAPAGKPSPASTAQAAPSAAVASAPQPAPAAATEPANARPRPSRQRLPFPRLPLRLPSPHPQPTSLRRTSRCCRRLRC